MERREFIALLGTLALPWTLPARAQSSRKIARVGVLWHAGSAEEEREYLPVLVKAFVDLGYTEGKNVEFLHKFPAEQAGQYSIFARELVESNVDVAIAVTSAGAVALKQVTSIIPIVFVIVEDPVGLGLVANLARPGGNLTGLSLMVADLSAKRLALLREAVPSLSRVAVFLDHQAAKFGVIQKYEAAGKALGVSVRWAEIPAPDAIEPAFAQAESDQIDGALALGPMLFNERTRVGAAALAHRIPVISGNAEMVPYGLLMSYGPDFLDYFRKAAACADKILHGRKPADLPVEQPTRLKQVINLKVAKTFGLTIPPSLLITTDEVIE
jgi:putative ABC transport system substrate-binding protein